MDRGENRLALIEVLGRDGSVTRTFDVHVWPVSIGRALANDIVLEDPYVAPHHAQLNGGDEDGQVRLSVQDTHNGVAHAGRRIDKGRPWPVPAAGATLQLGATRLRLRLPGEVLAPEKALPVLARSQRLLPLGAGVCLLALEWTGHWLALDPGADYSAWLPTLFGLPLVLAGWCGVWALLSKLFSHHFDFAGHLRIALPWMLAIAAVPALWPQVSAALDAPLMWQLTTPLQALLIALLLRQHLIHALPLRPRTVTIAVAACTLVASGVSLALTYRSGDSLRSEPYMSTLPLPALRLAGSVPSATLVQDMAPVAAGLAQRVKKARADEEDGGVDDGSD